MVAQIELRVEYLHAVSRSVALSETTAKAIEVAVAPSAADEAPRVVRVNVVDHREKKPFLGGFRHKTRAVEYHNASSQTPIAPKKRPDVEPVPKFERDTQTVAVSTRSVQSQRESGTQMSKPGVLVTHAGERQIVPKPYRTADEVRAIKVAAAITVQCWLRGLAARRRAAQKRKEMEAKRAFLAEQEQKRLEEAESQRKREVERRMQPKSSSDFAVLHVELEAWRQHETQRIKASDLSESEKKAALALVLNKETKLLQTIDRLRIGANIENRDEKIARVLELMAAPKRWQLQDGQVAEVETPFTIRAKELMDLYNGLKLPLLSIDERLDVLLHVKWTVKEFDCNLTRSITELLDREADMLQRNRPQASLAGLRKRTANLFLQFIETPEFNPEAVRFQKVPKELLTHTHNPMETF